VERLYVPGLRRAGDLSTAAGVAGNALVIHGAGENFLLSGGQVQRERLDGAEIVRRLRARR